MKALVNFAPDPHSVEIRDVAVPEIGAEDVLVEVKAVGICGSDLHQYEAKHSWPVNYPVVLGHEFCGVVAKAGRAVRNFAEGDRITSETCAVIDAASPQARAGQYHLDPARKGFGYGVDGAMAQYVRVPERCLHRLPDGLDFERAALTEPCCVAYNAVCVGSRIRPGDTVAVIGPGAIGLLCAMMAGLSGAVGLTVIGAATDEHRLEIARQLGAERVLGADPVEWIRSSGDGLGFDLVIDAAGVSAALKTALALVRPGGQITKVGWGPQPMPFSLDPLVQKGVTLQGSFSHNWTMWEKVLALMAAGRLDPGLILGRVSPLDGWREAFEEMRDGQIVKGVLRP